MDHQSINDTMNDTIIFNQDMCWLRWQRFKIFANLDNGAVIQWDTDDPRPAVDQIPDIELDTIHATQIDPKWIWPSIDNAAGLLWTWRATSS